MANTFIGNGNLGAAPDLKTVSVDGEQRQVLDMRVYVDRRIPAGDGEWDDKGGFWLNVSRWGSAAEHAARVLDKGDRVRVEGTLVQNSWTKDGEDRSRLELNADSITLALARVESVTRKPKQRPTSDTADQAGHGVATADEETADG